MAASSTMRAERTQGANKLVSVTDLSGGLDLRKSPTLLKPNRARLLRNWSLREPGALNVFPGWVTHSTTSLGAKRIQGGQRVYLGSGTPFTLAAYDGSVYQPDDDGVWGAAVSTGWNASNQVFFPYDRDMVAIIDGATAPKKSTDGTTWTNLGIAAPSGAPTTALVAGGSLVNGNTYEFSYSGKDDELGHEGNESATVQVATTPGNLTVRLTLTKHTDAQVDTLTIYGRDVTAGESIRRKIGTVANPAGASTTYDVTANSWASGVEAPTDHDVPPVLAGPVLVWKNRWWARDATVKNRWYFTQIFEPQSWPSDFYIDIPFDLGDFIAAASALGDTAVLFGQSKPFLVIGQTSLDFEVRPSGAAQAGALGPRAVDVLEDGVVHASAEGIYLFDGASDRLLSYDVDGFAPAAIGWRTYVTTASAADLEKTPVCYHKASKEVGIGVTNLYPFGSAGEWILDLNRTRLQDVPAWTTTDREIGGYLKWDGNETTIGNRGRLFSWTQATGELCEERTGTTADGGDLVADYHGPSFYTGGRVARAINGAVEFEPHGGTFGLELIVDDQSYGSQNVDISGAVSVYGTDVYGTGTYGGASRKREPMDFPMDCEGMTFYVKATYTGQEAFRWFGYGFELAPESALRGIA